jgi:hypothetical protein
MAKTNTHDQTHTSPTLFTQDDLARISVSAISAVLEKLIVGQIVDGVGVFPAGGGSYLVDIAMRDLATETTWGVSITFTPIQEEAEGHR